jgi:hypothetical protein
MSAVSIKRVFASLAMGASLIFALSSSGEAAEMATSASVYLYSEPGNYIGWALGAQQVEWTHGVDGIFEASGNYGNSLDGVDITYDNGSQWSFQFSAPSYNRTTNTNNGQLLQTGLYTHAERFPFNSPTLPGLTISGNGAGDNQDSGWFDVLSIAYNPDGTLASFAVDFEQYDTANSRGPGLYGSLRFNSDTPVDPVPLPGTLCLLLSGAVCAGLLVSRGGFVPVRPGTRSTTPHSA